jgi:DMSO/TMAO reductase YedYZ heme-binding membrane subunit
MFLAYLIGGYAAGRLARYGGLDNGLGVVLWTVIVAILLSIAAAVLNGRFAVAQQFRLGISQRDLTIAGVVSVLVTLIVMLIGAAAGGLLGGHYHRRIDRELGAVA